MSSKRRRNVIPPAKGSRGLAVVRGARTSATEEPAPNVNEGSTSGSAMAGSRRPLSDEIVTVPPVPRRESESEKSVLAYTPVQS